MEHTLEFRRLRSIFRGYIIRKWILEDWKFAHKLAAPKQCRKPQWYIPSDTPTLLRLAFFDEADAGGAQVAVVSIHSLNHQAKFIYSCFCISLLLVLFFGCGCPI